MIKAVLWDFGGVLTTSPFEAFNRFELEQKIPQNTIRKINSANPDKNAWARFESNQITLDEFDKAFTEESRQAGFKIRGRSVIELLAGALVPEMVAVLRCCAEHFKNACLTNNVRAGKGAAMQKSTKRSDEISQVLALFDFVIESSKVGIRKPDPRIYQLACQQLGVNPQEVVYLDDLGVNLKPAKQIGMTTIKVLNPQQAIEELQFHLQIPFVSENTML